MAKKRVTKKFTLILSGIFMLVCFASVIGIAYAWFVTQDKPTVDGTLVKIGGHDHDGYQFSKLDDKGLVGNEVVIYPGDILRFEVESLLDNKVFGLKFNIRLFDKAEFDEKFLGRDDLLNGYYQTIKELNDGGHLVESSVDFNIDSFLKKEGVPLQDIHKKKVDFLWSFAQNNSIASALTFVITKVGDTDCNITLSSEDIDDDWAKRFYLDGFDDIPKGTIINIEIRYASDGTSFYPKTEYNFGYGKKKYSSLNYNCFMGQAINLSFMNVRVA